SHAMRQATELLCDAPVDTELMIRVSALGFLTAFEIWDDRAFEQWPNRVMDTTRAAGGLGGLRVAMVSRAPVHALFGRFGEAELDNAATIDLTRALGGNPAYYELHALQLEAWRGRDASVRPTCEAILRAHEQAPDGPSVAHTCDMHMILLDVST